jgi:hypothetical protein
MAKGIKTGGREQGTPNMLTKEMRAILKNIISSELEQIPEILKKLEPEKRADLVIKLLPYVLPKVEAVTMSEGEPTIFNDWSLNIK